MIDLPFNPDALGDTMLARYLRADPRRVPVLQHICERLDDDGRVGDLARYYVIRSQFRRSVLRGVLTALGIPLPSWAYENREARGANQFFIETYREQYNAFRRLKRQRPGRATLPPTSSGKLWLPDQPRILPPISAQPMSRATYSNKELS